MATSRRRSITHDGSKILQNPIVTITACRQQIACQAQRKRQTHSPRQTAFQAAPTDQKQPENQEANKSKYPSARDAWLKRRNCQP
ncbi:hypothetical protein [Kingella oralis]|uniref:hypothetical protein n=1 Tax=Kingella oralis TaxID=505 RepID=UPI002D7EC1C8|nr:hypothetical protein [Kingella oralis]